MDTTGFVSTKCTVDDKRCRRHKITQLKDVWGNSVSPVETSHFTAKIAQAVGSAVAYFNQTYRAKKLLTAWAEAMQYKTNERAPDDQVLDLLLTEGEWLKRASFGWLPTSYQP